MQIRIKRTIPMGKPLFKAYIKNTVDMLYNVVIMKPEILVL